MTQASHEWYVVILTRLYEYLLLVCWFSLNTSYHPPLNISTLCYLPFVHRLYGTNGTKQSPWNIWNSMDLNSGHWELGYLFWNFSILTKLTIHIVAENKRIQDNKYSVTAYLWLAWRALNMQAPRLSLKRIFQKKLRSWISFKILNGHYSETKDLVTYKMIKTL